jgi:tRNA(adenine34) deaminase
MDQYISEIIKLSNKSLANQDVPVGAIIVKDNLIISKGYNTREKNEDVMGHAEINAIRSASKKLGNWNLQGCSLYVTLKPCSMCMEIIKQCRIEKVFYLLDKPTNKKEFNKTVVKQIDSKENIKKYNEILSNFFVNLRVK